MGLKIASDPSIADVIRHLGTNKDVPDLAQYGPVQALLKLAIDHQCHNIVELHAPHSRAGYVLCKAFDDVNVTSVCNPHVPHNHLDNLNCIEDWSSNTIKTFDNHTLDLVFIHDHDTPEHELFDTLSNWLLKVKPGGVICGSHFGLQGDMTRQGGALYEFAERERLTLSSYTPHLFVCYNDPEDKEPSEGPIRMVPLND